MEISPEDQSEGVCLLRVLGSSAKEQHGTLCSHTTPKRGRVEAQGSFYCPISILKACIKLKPLLKFYYVKFASGIFVKVRVTLWEGVLISVL